MADWKENNQRIATARIDRAVGPTCGCGQEMVGYYYKGTFMCPSCGKEKDDSYSVQ